MKEWTHDELHEIIDSNQELKAKSDEVHALPSPTSFEEAESRKMQMMGIYAEAIGCSQAQVAQNAVKEVYDYLKSHFSWGDGHKLSEDDWEAINGIARIYSGKQMCHSPKGNDFVCYCDETGWVKFLGRVGNEDETGITLEATDESEAILRFKSGDYRKGREGNIEIRIGSRAEFLKYPKGCKIRKKRKGIGDKN